jgi:UDP:flavonoid glycosyltransferase YjiC (YdhE family)
MSEILFVTWDGGGNVAPAVEIGHELQRGGHRVKFLGQAQQRDSLERAGFGFSAYRRPGPWTASGKRGPVQNAVGFLRLLTGRNLGRDLLAEVKATPTDIVVIDCLLFGALDVATRASLRHAVLVHSLYEAIDTKMASGAPGAVARLTGLRPRKLWAASDLLVVATLKELDRASGAVPSNAHYTGPALGGEIRPATPTGRPRVLVSLSTTYLPRQALVLQSILDALADLDVTVVVTTGPAVDAGGLRVPANAEVHDYLPHSEVMPTVSLVVGHGGHSTTMLALAHDLPLVILPMNPAFDQELIGAAIQRSGAGLSIPSTSSTDEIRAAVQRTLNDPSARRQAARLGADIRASRGSRAAAELLLGALG